MGERKGEGGEKGGGKRGRGKGEEEGVRSKRKG